MTRLLTISLVLFSVIPANSMAEAVFDGSMGPTGTLTGDVEITDSFGTQVGGNLFHSFSALNVNTGESVTFTSAFTGVTDNVIARVTGPSITTIDGPLGSTIPQADLWLINPNGVVVGSEGEISVPAAFHLSSADYLVLDGGGRFDATNPANTVLTMTDPVSFGFIDASPAAIAVGDASLSFSDGQQVSIVAGDLSLTGTTVTAPGSRMDLVSVAGAAEVTLGSSGILTPGTTAFGSIQMDAAAIDTSSAGSGPVFIRGGQFVMTNSSTIKTATSATDPSVSGGRISVEVSSLEVTNSQISSLALAAADAGDISISATGDVTLQGRYENESGGVVADTQASATGNGGDISITASNLNILEETAVATRTYGDGATGNVQIDLTEDLYMRSTWGWFDAQILARSGFGTVAMGNVGSINIDAQSILMERGALIQANTYGGTGGSINIDAQSLTLTGGSQFGVASSGPGDAGTIAIDADNVLITGSQFVPSFNNFILSGLFGSTSGSGRGGTIDITADSLTVDAFARITATNFSSGNAGSIEIDASALTVANGAWINTFAQFGSTGDGGPITLSADQIQIRNGSIISAGTGGTGSSGNVSVTATDSVFIDGEFGQSFTGVFANTFGNGNGGQIEVASSKLTIVNGGFVQAGSFSFFPTATGNGNDVYVTVDELNIDGGFIETSTWTSGDAGTIFVQASGTVTLQNSTDFSFSEGLRPIGGLLAAAGSPISSPDATGAAGGVVIEAHALNILDGGVIGTDTFSLGNGGDIQVSANSISANSNENPYTGIASGTVGFADAGSIDIDAGSITLSGQAVFFAETLGSANAGVIEIDADNFSIVDGGSITTTTDGAGAAGRIDITVTDTFRATRGDLGQYDNVSSSTNAEGAGGTVTITGEQVVLEDGAIISADTQSSGRGGSITIFGDLIEVTDGGTITSASSGSGAAGSVLLVAVDSVTVDNASVATSSEISSGGNIEIQAENMVYLNNGALISAAANGVTPDDGGGNVLIDPVFVILRESTILASANAGNGGNISITADSIIVDTQTTIDASSETGLDGRVNADSINQVFETVLLFDPDELDISKLLTDRCAAAVIRDRSSLTVQRSAKSLWSPEDLIPSPEQQSADPRLARLDQRKDTCRIVVKVEAETDV